MKYRKQIKGITIARKQLLLGQLSNYNLLDLARIQRDHKEYLNGTMDYWNGDYNGDMSLIEMYWVNLRIDKIFEAYEI